MRAPLWNRYFRRCASRSLESSASQVIPFYPFSPLAPADECAIGQLCTLSTLYNAIYLPTSSNGKSQSTTVMFSHFPEICLELFALAAISVRLLAGILRREQVR